MGPVAFFAKILLQQRQTLNLPDRCLLALRCCSCFSSCLMPRTLLLHKLLCPVALDLHRHRFQLKPLPLTRWTLRPRVFHFHPRRSLRWMFPPLL
jgi:hypothetical protein